MLAVGLLAAAKRARRAYAQLARNVHRGACRFPGVYTWITEEPDIAMYAAIPEPSTALLVLTGRAVLRFLGRRRATGSNP